MRLPAASHKTIFLGSVTVDITDSVSKNNNDIQVITSLSFSTEGNETYQIVADFVPAVKVKALEDKVKEYQTMEKPRRGEAWPSLSGVHWVSHLQRSYPENTLVVPIVKNLDAVAEGPDKTFVNARDVMSDDLVYAPVDSVIVPNDIIQVTITGLFGPGVESVRPAQKVSSSGKISGMAAAGATASSAACATARWSGWLMYPLPANTIVGSKQMTASGRKRRISRTRSRRSASVGSTVPSG